MFRSSIISVLLFLSVPAYAERRLTLGAETNQLSVDGFGVGCTASVDKGITTAAVRTGTYSYYIDWNNINGSCSLVYTYGTNTSGTFYFRTYFRFSAAPAVQSGIFRTYGSGVDNQRILLNTDRTLTLRNNVTSTNYNGATVLSTNTWYRIELMFTLSDTVGAIELRINGVTEASASNIDTMATNWAYFALGYNTVHQPGDIQYYYDDFALNNTTGSFQNSWPGAGRISTAKPNGTLGGDWTRYGGGTLSYADLDETPTAAPDDVTTTAASPATANSAISLEVGIPAEVPSDAVLVLAQPHIRWNGDGTIGTRQIRMNRWNDSLTQTNGTTTNACDTTTWSTSTDVALANLSLASVSKTTLTSYRWGAENLNNVICYVSALWVHIEWNDAYVCTNSIALMGAGCK